MLEYINIEYLVSRAKKDAEEFKKADPFKHIVFSQFLHEQKLNKIIESFPSLQQSAWKNVGHELQKGKYSFNDILEMPMSIRQLIFELQSGPVIKWLEIVSNNKNLLPDPHLFGAGLQCMEPNSFLTPHADFQFSNIPNLKRKLTLIIYLNEQWNNYNYGALELWEGNKVKKDILPKKGQVILFETSSKAIHGISKPIKNSFRKSLALFYYSSQLDGVGEIKPAVFWQLNKVNVKNENFFRKQLANQLMRISHLFLKFHYVLNQWSKKILNIKTGNY